MRKILSGHKSGQSFAAFNGPIPFDATKSDSFMRIEFMVGNLSSTDGQLRGSISASVSDGVNEIFSDSGYYCPLLVKIEISMEGVNTIRVTTKIVRTMKLGTPIIWSETRSLAPTLDSVNLKYFNINISSSYGEAYLMYASMETV